MTIRPQGAAPAASANTVPDRHGPLSGLRVVEISSYVATPLCGMTLHQLGADVIRIEPLGGAPDRTRLPRSAQGASLYWNGLNQGKRALAVDMSRSQGRELVRDLICGTGSSVDDPGGAIALANSERYHDLTYDGLVERRPDLVYALLSGRRDGGSAVDYTVQASTGFPTLTGPKDSVVPSNGVIPAWDIAAGLYLATGILAGVHGRRETGRGRHLTIALEDVALSLAGALGYIAESQLSGVQRGPSGNDVFGTFGRDFITADGVRFMVVVLTDRHWHRLLDGMGLVDAMTAVEKAVGADFSEEAERYRCRQVIGALLGDWFERHSWSEAQVVLSTSRALHAPYRSFDDLAADGAALLRANPLFAELEQPGVGRYLAPGGPLRIDDRQVPPAPAPRVGEHSDEVLAGLGLDPDRLAALHRDGVIG
ncbi:CoA transferase [Flexivirga oryzae]|uniref:2-methylfumaryl-CoA isomerase n=1 Tax=Flexivirga oryzae TaxID=1794944 RepID=A0A839NC95_9MICO|nr:CoA transferase [Flexivirga oryzae]MBB2893584.1 2-methylfumaryl-CoA isomerase [Flexivirga oryzae]